MQIANHGGCEVHVVESDIAEVQADALITAVNGTGVWFGGIDGVIRRCAGGVFHNQARQHLPFREGGTIVSKKKEPHAGKFGDVVFVADDLTTDLRHVVRAGLRRAEEEGYATVSMPAIRTGVMLGAYEKTVEQTVGQLGMGIHDFFALSSQFRLRKITVVAYQDRAVYERLMALRSLDFGC